MLKAMEMEIGAALWSHVAWEGLYIYILFILFLFIFTGGGKTQTECSTTLS